MSYYEDVYLRRLNRYGDNYQDRLQGQREKVFEDLLLKSPYRVDFAYNNTNHPGLLERYKQDDTQTMQYLLTRVSLNIPHGTILTIPDKDNQPVKWMIYYLENIEASGYNRYFVLKMNYEFTQWRFSASALTQIGTTQYAYLYGPTAKKETGETFYGSSVIFEEHSNKYYLIMPRSTTIEMHDNIKCSSTVAGQTVTQQFKVDRIDNISNPGVCYIMMDPVYETDATTQQAPTKPVGSTDASYDWFTGDFGGNNQ